MTPEQLQQQATMLGNRIRKNFKHLQKAMAREQIEAFRLYDRDIPELRLVADWYAGHVVLGEYVREQTDFPEYLPAMANAVAQALEIPLENLHLKQRRTGARGHRYGRMQHTGQRLQVREGDLIFLCNLEDFIDTGLYADHRLTRRLVRNEAKGKDFLNLFSYTGAFTVAAVKGGAQSSVSVDASQQYLDWTRENLELNHLFGAQHTFAAMDVLAWLDWAARHDRHFDLAVVDPPSFSANRAANREFDVQRDHPALLRAVLAVMRPGGVIYFSTNHQRFQPMLEDLPVTIADLTKQTHPVDFRNEDVRHVWRLALNPEIR